MALSAGVGQRRLDSVDAGHLLGRVPARRGTGGGVPSAPLGHVPVPAAVLRAQPRTPAELRRHLCRIDRPVSAATAGGLDVRVRRRAALHVQRLHAVARRAPQYDRRAGPRAVGVVVDRHHSGRRAAPKRGGRYRARGGDRVAVAPRLSSSDVTSPCSARSASPVFVSCPSGGSPRLDGGARRSRLGPLLVRCKSCRRSTWRRTRTAREAAQTSR